MASSCAMWVVAVVLAAAASVSSAASVSLIGSLAQRASAHRHGHRWAHGPAPVPAPAPAPLTSSALAAPGEPEAVAEAKKVAGKDMKVAVNLGPVDRDEEVDPLRKKREQVAAMLWLEARLRELRQGLDEQHFASMAAEGERQAASEVSMPETVNTLGEMRKEVHRFAAPVYQKAVEEELISVASRREELLRELAEATPMAPLPEDPATLSAPKLNQGDAAKGAKEESPPQVEGFWSGRTGDILLGLAVIAFVVWAALAHLFGGQTA
mmetsp:Transcript_142956/g.456789  ORF Transcript_142956/g.456789 Transcript_142956/m.456789 type:complete len:267 (+) Transcript_142956:67-867(+)